MDNTTKLIHQTHISHLPTTLPVNFYGLQNGDVYVIYSRFYEKDFDNSGLEFVFALHEEFFYDFEYDELIMKEKNKRLFSVFPEMVDKPEPKIKIKKVSRKLKSYSEALKVLNGMVSKKVYCS